MRSVFAFAVAAVVSGVAFGGQEPQSVLVESPAPAVASSAGCDCGCRKNDCGCSNGACQSQSQLICVNGRCGEQKLYSADTRSNETCRNRLFGGKVVRKTSRTVVKPVR
jgi:hypothetical protein